MLERTALFAFIVAAANVALFAILGGYDWRFGPVHLVASNAFKPLLYLNGAFLLVLAMRKPGAAVPPIAATPGKVLTPSFCAAALALTLAMYAPSFLINLSFYDWTHSFITERQPPFSFFLHRQYDGFYRPLTFLSLWLDNKLFGRLEALYHLQNLLLHIANTLLAARLARRLGLNLRAARICGLLFCTVPAGFEAVIWPGARFDLMAIAFSLLALERAVAGRLVLSTLAFICAVLSKESAYALPFLVGVLWAMRRRLEIAERGNDLRRALIAFTAAACVLVALRFAVYGNFGGYPAPEEGKTIHFQASWRTITSLVTRVPAAVFVVNTASGLDVAMRVVVLAYSAVLAATVFAGAGLGRRGFLVLLPYVAALPALNVIAWLNEAAQQSRYVYFSSLWVVFAVARALSGVRRERLLAASFVAVFAAAAVVNVAAYLRMLRGVDQAVEEAAALCRSKSCCTLWIRDVPRDLFGAFHFGHQVWKDLEKALPDRRVPDPATTDVKQDCELTLHWVKDSGWREAGPSPSNANPSDAKR